MRYAAQFLLQLLFLDNLDTVKAVAGSNTFMQIEIFKVVVKNNLIVSNTSGA